MFSLLKWKGIVRICIDITPSECLYQWSNKLGKVIFQIELRALGNGGVYKGVTGVYTGVFTGLITWVFTGVFIRVFAGVCKSVYGLCTSVFTDSLRGCLLRCYWVSTGCNVDSVHVCVCSVAITTTTLIWSTDGAKSVPSYREYVPIVLRHKVRWMCVNRLWRNYYVIYLVLNSELRLMSPSFVNNVSAPQEFTTWQLAFCLGGCLFNCISEYLKITSYHELTMNNADNLLYQDDDD